MTQLVNFKWPQGEDLRIQLIYKEGNDPKRAVAVPLNTGYSIRMDIVSGKEIVYTFNSAVADGPVEGILGSGANGQPNIDIYVPRGLTLVGGAIYNKLNGTPPVSSFAYDIFLRNTITDKQVKILKGSISIEASNTLWQ